MAVAFRSVGASSVGFAQDQTVSATGLGIQDDDILIWGTDQDDGGGGTTITYPSGFTEIADVSNNSGQHRFQCAWKRASSESGDYVASLASTKWSQSYLLVYSGAYATGDPQDATASTNGGSDDAPVGLSISPASSNSMLVMLVGKIGTHTDTPPSGMTERFNTSNLIANDLLLSSSGATGDKTASSSSSSWWLSVMIALKEADGGGGTTTRRYSLSLTGVG